MSSPIQSSGLPQGDVSLKDHSGVLISAKAFPDQAELATGPRILVVDDDVHLGKFLGRELRRRNFSVVTSQDGMAGYECLQESNYDLVILDMNMPRMDGMTVIKQVRQSQPRLPILVLTARNRTEDLVSALEQGADDCLIKPFSFLELLARVRGLLRRNAAPPQTPSKVSNLTINRNEHWVKRGERRIDLTVREFALLEYLSNNAGKAVSRKTLMEEVWNVPYDSTTNIVDVYMKYLRDKIDLDEDTKLIRTVRGVGYVLNNS
jgi:DNA-binding response OmpR family regulator